MLSRALGAFVRPARFSLAAASQVAAANLRVRATTFASLSFKHAPIMLVLGPVRGFAVDAAPPKAVLLQLGSSSFRPIEGVLDKNVTALFKAVRADDTFTTDLKLGDCIVEAAASATDEPDAGAKWLLLKGITTLGQLWEQQRQLESAGPYLHVRVRLPSAPAAAAAATPAPMLEDYNNVLTAPVSTEVPATLQAAVKTFADSGQDWAARLAALNVVGEALLEHAPAALRKAISLPLLDMESHLTLLAALVQRAEQLEAGNYEGLNGVACRLLLGARGIGKTNLAQAFIYACPKAFPSIIPLYVTGAELSKKSSFQQMDLEDLMIATARAHGVEVDESKGAHALTDALEKAGKRMLIIVDEIDHVYCVDNSEPKLRQNAMYTLRHLQGLGNQKSGRYAVLLCGSSASTYSLICRDINEHLLHRFPLLQASPDLNSTKFMPLPIPSAPCTATAQVEAILIMLGRVSAEEQEEQQATPGADQTATAQPRKSLQLARLLTFFVGTTPRAITSALEPTKDGVLPAERLQQLVMALMVAKLRAGTVEGHAGELFIELLRLPQDANSEVHDLLRAPDGTANTTAVMLEDWEGKVKPLEWAQVQHAWSELAKNKQLPDPHSASYLHTLVSILSDASLVPLRLDPGTSGYCVWPASAAQLVYSYQGTVAVQVLEGAARELQPLVRAVRTVQPLAKAVKPLAKAVGAAVIKSVTLPGLP